MSKQSKVGAGGCLVLLAVLAVIVVLGAFFWGWVLMLCLGAANITPSWGYWHSVFPFGLIASVLFGGPFYIRSRKS